jgi:hypothetical protein
MLLNYVSLFRFLQRTARAIPAFPCLGQRNSRFCHGIAVEQSIKVCENFMQNSSAHEPLRVTQEAVDAYERWSGFHGIGEVMVERGVWVIVCHEAMVHTDCMQEGHQNRNNSFFIDTTDLRGIRGDEKRMVFSRRFCLPLLPDLRRDLLL